MKTSCYAVPADFKLSTVAKLAQTQAGPDRGVVEVYGSLNPCRFASSRRGRILPKVNMEELASYVRELSRYGIEFNYTLNSTCLGNREYDPEYAADLQQFITQLAKIGIRRFTVAVVSLLDVFAKVPGVKVTISTAAGITSVSALDFLERFDFVDRMCVPEHLNRNIEQLRHLKSATRLEFSTIINNRCLLNCGFRQMHYDFISHVGALPQELATSEYYGTLCGLERLKHPAALLCSGWIRPEDIDLYVDAGVKMFKVAGREIPDADFCRVVECCQARRFKGNLLDFFECFGQNPYWQDFELDSEEVDKVMPDILGKPGGCNDVECIRCRICDNWAQQNNIIKPEAAAKWSKILKRKIGDFS